MRGPSEQCIYLYPDYRRKDGLLTRLFLQQSWQHSRVAICHRKYSTFHSFTASCCPPPPLPFSLFVQAFREALEDPNGRMDFFVASLLGHNHVLFPSYLIDHIFLGHHFLHFTVYYLFMFMCMQCSVRNSQMIVVSQETIYLPHDLHPNDFNSV